MLPLLAQVATSEPTEAGRFFYAAYTTLAVGALAALGTAIAWLLSKIRGMKLEQAFVVATEVVRSVVAHVEVEIRPLVAKALEDGKLSAQEGRELKAKALELVKTALGKQALGVLVRALGEGGVTVYLSGLIERMLGVQRAAGVLPPPPPASTREESTVVARAPGSFPTPPFAPPR